MDIQALVILSFFIILIVFYIRDIRSLLFPTLKTKLEIITTVLGSIIIFFIVIKYGKNYMHFLLGFLAIVLMTLSLLRKGITSSGFRSIRGINSGDWEKLKSVRISKKNRVRIDYTTAGNMFETHYYKNEDYDRILDLLVKKLSPGLLKIS